MIGMKEKLQKKATKIRWRNWEYWSSNKFYWFMWVWGPLLALRARHPAFFTAANPGIYTGGFGFESKYETMLKIPAPYRPKTILAKKDDDCNLVFQKIAEAGITFPFIAKPDLGFRGFLVKKIDSTEELKSYLAKYPIDFIIQEFVWKDGEFGILYHRFPNKKSGNITSVTLKEFLKVRGDGQSTVQELVTQHPRALLQLERLQALHPQLLSTVPVAGEYVSLGVIGNHSKGTRFISGNHLVDKQLIETFDKIADQIPGYCYGRFDIKCDSWELLKQGKDITIIELNGTCSEPTHIYDPEKSSYFKALYQIFWHWGLVQRIAVANHRLGAPFLPTREMLGILKKGRDYFRYIKMLERNDK